MNYSELVDATKAYVENDFPSTAGSGDLTSTEQLNIFIKEAEQRIYNAVQLLDLRKSATLTTTSGTATVASPSDWLANFSLAVIAPVTGAYTFLLNKDVTYIREAYPTPTSTGTPTHYALQNNDTFLLGPTPDAAYSLALTYFYYPESIVTAGTSWLGDNFDSALLYGTLLEAYTFMKGEEDVIAQYQKRYEEAMNLLKQLSEGKNRQDTYRTLQTRYPVR
jgi:hypothetical protein